ncbi:MerR family transcriptional regulator [Cellulomonas sp. C5510]|uniref:MerR family transcriptional regulator n=1 Tax=Cellulomonas sp. C5510 TaxID=2871170 RepID=UPI001C9670E1|nr:MerR family transcriptional regulator [Cellulomonas sp. C5510]QZN85637.1 MerR family transcriptional regulator [Cellulomonas sp. C5510]
MTTRTTGDLARAAAVSEKAVRLYADRGLLHADRDPGSGARVFAEDQVEVVRRIALLRGLGVPLADVAAVLGAVDPVAVFDALWSERRRAGAREAGAAEYARSVLAGAPRELPAAVSYRDVPERLLLTLAASATLSEMAEVLPAATGRLFAHLTEADVPLAGPVHVRIRSRATETFPADLVVCVPVPAPLRPPAGTALEVDPAHREAVVGLDQRQADDQQLLVAVHDHLSTGAAGGPTPWGDNREVYLPAWGTGAPGVVLEVVVPVAAPA